MSGVRQSVEILLNSPTDRQMGGKVFGARVNRGVLAAKGSLSGTVCHRAWVFGLRQTQKLRSHPAMLLELKGPSNYASGTSLGLVF
jgi:hypothetical protein